MGWNRIETGRLMVRWGIKHQKSIGPKVLLPIAAIALALGVQVSGSGISKTIRIAALEYVVGLLGFVPVGYPIYKRSIK